MKHESHTPLTAGFVAREVAPVLHRGAEAGGAGQRAVAARQAASGDVVPARVLEVPVQQLLDAVGVHRAAHAARRCAPRSGRRSSMCSSAACAEGRSAITSAPRSVPTSTRNACSSSESSSVSARSYPCGHLGAGAHRDAEARPTGLGAVHRDQERAARAGHRRRDPARPGRRRHGPARRSRRSSHARTPMKAYCGVRRLRVLGEHRLSVARRGEQRRDRWEQEPLPRMRADGVAEEGVVLAPLQSVAAGSLLVRPARRERGGRGQLVVDDRLLPEGRSDDRVPAVAKGIEQEVQVVGLDDDLRLIAYGSIPAAVHGCPVVATLPAHPDDAHLRHDPVTGIPRGLEGYPFPPPGEKRQVNELVRSSPAVREHRPLRASRGSARMFACEGSGRQCFLSPC